MALPQGQEWLRTIGVTMKQPSLTAEGRSSFILVVVLPLFLILRVVVLLGCVRDLSTSFHNERSNESGPSQSSSMLVFVHVHLSLCRSAHTSSYIVLDIYSIYWYSQSPLIRRKLIKRSWCQSYEWSWMTTPTPNIQHAWYLLCF